MWALAKASTLVRWSHAYRQFAQSRADSRNWLRICSGIGWLRTCTCEEVLEGTSICWAQARHCSRQEDSDVAQRT